MNQVSDDFLDNTRSLLADWEKQMDENEGNLFLNDEDIETNIILNSELTMNELTNSLKQVKSNKATGIENTPNEILKCTRIRELLLKLF